jgi:hypothetical protein
LKGLRIAVGLVLGLAVLAPVSAYVLDRAFGITVLPVARSAPEAVRANKALYEEGDSVAEIYGVPGERKLRVIFVSKDLLVTPSEDPKLQLLLINKQEGDNPLQVKTLYFVAWRVTAGLAAVSLLGLVLLMFVSRLRRKRTPSTPTPMASAPAPVTATDSLS